MAERNYETVPALRGEAVWETKLDQGDAYDDGHGHGHEVYVIGGGLIYPKMTKYLES